jgi:hypothetical protein
VNYLIESEDDSDGMGVALVSLICVWLKIEKTREVIDQFNFRSIILERIYR